MLRLVHKRRRRTRRRVIRRKAPVTSDQHTQVAPASKHAATPQTDPLANAPVVEDDIGVVVALPASASAPPVAPPSTDGSSATSVRRSDRAVRPASAPSDAASAPAATADPSDATPSTQSRIDGGYSAYAVAPSPSALAAPHAPHVKLRVVTVGAKSAGNLQLFSVETARALSSASTGGTSGPLDTSPAPSTGGGTPDPSGAVAPSDTGANNAAPNDTQGSAANGGATAGTGGGTGGNAGATGGTIPTQQSSTSSQPPTDVTLPAKDPASEPGSGPSPPVAWAPTISGDGAHTISASVDGANIVVTIDGSTQSNALASIASLTLVGGAGSDTFTIDASLASAGVPVTFDGGAGSDTLNGPSSDSTWTVDGAGSGTVGGVHFAGFEHLVGAAGNKDDFTVTGSGSVTSVDGGAGGYDTVAALGNSATVVSTITGPDSGTIQRDGDTLIYSGMEPATLSGGGVLTVNLGPTTTSVTIHDNGTANEFLVTPDVGEEQTISNASTVTSLTINAHSGVTTTFILHAVDSAFTGTIHLVGDTGADHFTVSGYTGTSTIAGNGGGDTYSFGDQFGTSTVTGSQAQDHLDFTPRDLSANPLTVDATNKIFTATGQTLTIVGTEPGSIDVNLLGGIASTLAGVIDQVQQLEQAAQDGITQLRNALPLLPLDTTKSLATLTDTASKLHTFVTGVDTALGALSGDQTLSALTSAIGGVTNDLGLVTTTGWRRDPTGSHHLQVLISLALDKNSPFSLALDFGAQAAQVGLQADALTISGSAHLTGALIFGATTDSATATPFFSPESNLSFHVSASTGSVSGISLHLNFLTATIAGHATIGGSVVLNALDPSGDDTITASELSSNGFSTLLSVTPSADPFDVSFTASLSGLTATNSGSAATPIVSATFTVSLAGTIFGDDTGPASPTVTFSADGAAIDLINHFSSIGPSDVLGMLQQLGTMLGSMASSAALNLPIPFTSMSIGDALDFATSFKHKFVDPLFKSGDSSQPDANGDGKFDFKDINFDSIQSLLDKLDAMMGLAPGTLKANFDETTNELTFAFSFDDNLGLGTPVIIASAPIATIVSVQNGSSASGSEADEIQLIVVNATGGTFKIGLADNESTSSFSATADEHVSIQNAIQTFKVGGVAVYSGKVTVAKHGNVYTVVFDDSVGDVGLLSVDSSNLTGTLADQTVIVPGGTARFWLAYPNSGGTLDLTNALSSGSDVTSALNGLSAISSATVSKADLSGITGNLVGGSKAPTIFKVHNPGGTEELVGLGGFAVDFGTSVGDLASVKTSGSIIPLAQLSIHAIFGIDLNSTSMLQIAPASVTNGPQATITTTAEGGSGASVTTTQQGDGTNREIQQLTVRGAGGTFTLTAAGRPTATVSWTLAGDADSSITAALTTIGSSYASPFSISHIDTAAGRVYTIEFNTTTNIGQLTADGTLLTGRHEQQTLKVTSATGGTFSLTDGTNHLTNESPTPSNLATDLTGAGFLVSVPTNSSIANGHSWVIQFNDTVDHDPLAVDPSLLRGALDNGILFGDAHFELQIYNGPAVQVLTTQTAVATAAMTTTTDGGRSATVTSSGARTFTLSVKASGGSYTLKWSVGSTSTSVSAGADATAIKTALGGIVGGASHVTVTATTGAAGSSAFTIVFDIDGTLSVSTATGAQISTFTPGDATHHEQQNLTTDPAGSVFTLAWANPTPVVSGYLSPTISVADLQTAIDGIVGAGEVTVGTTSANHYTFIWTSFGDKPLLVLDASTLAPQNEVQKLMVTGAIGGTFTLTFGGHTSDPMAYNVVQGTLAAQIATLVGATVDVAPITGGYSVTFSHGSLAGTNVNSFTSNSSSLLAQDEQQTVTVINADGGTFLLSYNGHKTQPIDWNASAADVQSKLNTAIGGSPSVTVTSPTAKVYVVDFARRSRRRDARRRRHRLDE